MSDLGRRAAGVFALLLGLCATTRAAETDIQIASVNFVTQVIEVHNFGPSAQDLSGWRFCTHDDNELFRYTASTGLNGVTLDPGASLFLHALDDGVQPNELNISDLAGTFATPIDTGPYSVGLYWPNGSLSFTSPADLADHVQWNIDGVHVPPASPRASVAVNALLWTAADAWVSTAVDSATMTLADDPAVILDGPASYMVEALPPADARLVQLARVDLQDQVIEIRNLNLAAVDLTGWMLCLSDDSGAFNCSTTTGLDAISLGGFQRLMIHLQDDAPAAPDAINGSALGLSEVLSAGPHALTLYHPDGGAIDMADPDDVVDHLQWNVAGSDDPVAAPKSPVAVAAGLWVASDDWVSTSSSSLRLVLDPMDPFLHDGSSYVTVNPDPRLVQIVGVDFETQVVELKNFDSVEYDLAGWRLCTHTAGMPFRYSDANGLAGVILAPGASLFVHWLNDAPGGDAMNIDAIGGSFAPLNRTGYAMGLYWPNGNLSFSSFTDLADYAQWSVGGAHDPTVSVRAAIAINAALWIDATDWIPLTEFSVGITLTDPPEQLLHSPTSYAVEEPPPPDPRLMQIASIDFDAQVIELHNFSNRPIDLTGYRFCTHDDDDLFRYTGANGLNGVEVPGETSLFIHWLDDAPAGDPERLNVTDLGGFFAAPLSSQVYSIGLYWPNGSLSFSSAADLADHCQWSHGGADAPSATPRAGVAISAGLWSAADEWASTEEASASLVLNDATGGLLHGAADYDSIVPVCPCERIEDGVVGVDDLLDFLAAWFELGPSADFDVSGTVDVMDLLGFLACWFPSSVTGECA